mmetsp:Transcript_19871/g.32055  ORF Transcript_19871/g.32055 Transcript_19871/m.32055 type:complete len:126 (-) Transcript_19871:142-519(-)
MSKMNSWAQTIGEVMIFKVVPSQDYTACCEFSRFEAASVLCDWWPCSTHTYLISSLSSHEKATFDPTDMVPQPGYQYAQTVMKAKPLGSVPKLQKLSQRIALMRNVQYWNIGCHCVLYRGMTCLV